MSSRVTAKQISKAIFEKYNIVVSVSRGGDCYHFYSEDESTDLRLASWPSTTVPVYRLNHLSVDQWVEHFTGLMESAEK